ncbi:MAG: hypothetical protein Q4D45_06995 [Lachnospiraceae bacterium]|nr:hypothetical protein [Lachnospiraceae bacterium]
MQYLYQIAGLYVCCEIPFPVKIYKESADFVYEEMEKSHKKDLTVFFQPIKELETTEENGVWDIDRYHVHIKEKRKVYYCPAPHHHPYACVIWDDEEKSILRCRYIQGKEYYLNYSRNLCDIIALDSLLLNHQGLLLHASFIRWHGKGLLFSAPSGTGKSTQADLWVKYEGAEIINGDRAGLRKLEDGWMAYGLPYAGSSGIYRNESAPVTAIIVLRQAKENRIRSLRPAEAIRYLYPEIIVHQWDKEFVDQAMDLLTELVSHVPVYLLECLPDQGAVKLVKTTVFGE